MISGQKVNLISLFGYEVLTVKNKTTYSKYELVLP